MSCLSFILLSKKVDEKDDFFSGQVQITISSTELFDFSEGEPPQEYLTIFRALDVS